MRDNLGSGQSEKWNRIVQLIGGLSRVTRWAMQSFGKARAQEAAASIAYYSVFSLFPLLLLFVAVGGYLVESERSYKLVVEIADRLFPAAKSLIGSNLRNVLSQRGTVGLVGLAGLLWSATRAFVTLARNVNRAWSSAASRGFLERRLVAIAMVGILAVLLVLLMVSGTVLQFLLRLEFPFLGIVSPDTACLWSVLSELVPWLFAFLMFLGLYRWVPEAKVQWSSAFWGALIAAIAWEVATRGIVWYLGSGLARYELVYGSLSAVVALMLWIYVSAWIALFGAHLSAAVADSDKSERYSGCPTSGHAGRNRHPRDRGWEAE